MSTAVAPAPFLPVPTGQSAADIAVRKPPAGSLAIPGVKPASALEVRPAPDMVSFGIASLDALTGGVPRGGLTEMVGPTSSGRTSVMISLMAEITRRQEVCALIDVTGSFDPMSAEKAGVDLKRLLWIRTSGNREQANKEQAKTVTFAAKPPLPSGRPPVDHGITNGCFEATRGRREPALMNKIAPPAKNISWSIHENYDSRLRHAMVSGNGEARQKSATLTTPTASKPAPMRVNAASVAEAKKAKWDRLDQALKAADLLIQSGGFGLIVIDLGDIPAEQARRIPLTSWFRFQRAIENTPAILLVIARDSCAKTCASLVMNLSATPKTSGPEMTHVRLLDGLNVHVDLARTRLERKPVRSVGANLATSTSWKKLG